MAGEYLQADALVQLQPFRETVEAAGVKVELQVLMGSVIPTILTVTDATGADLIVMGTHGRTGLARVMLGSIAEGVAHKAHVPVMLVRRESRPECARENCEWCPHEGRSRAEERIAAEGEG